ncbi:MAG: hypothetical protein K0S04_1638 [Herbinix sp.]|jgi:hypothetical protein|nr:hypothetical protein [Herbinix sp.]
MDWFNVFGLLIVIFLLIPNMVYFYLNKNKPMVNKCRNNVIIIAEQIGRYGSMALMVFNIGIFGFSFRTHESFVFYLIINAILILLYWMFWYLYIRRNGVVFSLLLAFIPSVIFILNGVLVSHWLLVLVGTIFAVSHIYITYQNACTD